MSDNTVRYSINIMKYKLLGLILLVAGTLNSCNVKPAYDNFNGFVQGTTYNMIIENKGNLIVREVKHAVDSILHDFDMSLSLYQDSSILSRINRNENATPDSYFIAAFNKSAEINKLTDGAFDITVGPLVKAWGFGPDSHKNFTEQKHDSLMALVGMDQVKLADGKIIKSKPEISLDFNAIAQGYSVDVICSYFDLLGIKSYLVEIGGEVRVKGSKAGDYWKIGIDRPEDNNFIPGNELQAVVRMKERSLATSGNYRKFYVENGIKYSHTIDPKTGYPAKNQLLSATILVVDCATADGIATACMVKGKDKTIAFLADHPEFEAFLVYSDDKGNFMTWMSEGLKNLVSEPAGK